MLLDSTDVANLILRVAIGALDDFGTQTATSQAGV